QSAEREPAQHAEGERLDLERIAEWTDVVKRREDDRRDDDGKPARDPRAEPEQRTAHGGKTGDEKHAEEQFLVEASAERQHEAHGPRHRFDAPFPTLRDHQHLQRSDELRRRDADDEAERASDRGRFDEHGAKDERAKSAWARAKIANNQ